MAMTETITETDRTRRAENALIVTIRRLADRRRLTPKEAAVLIDKAKEFIRSCNLDQRELSFEKTHYYRLMDLRNIEMKGCTVKVRVHPREWEEPTQYEYDDEHGKRKETLLTTLLVEDDEGHKMSTVDIIDADLVRKVTKDAHEYAFLDLLATVVYIPISESPDGSIKNDFGLLVHDSRPSDRIMQIAEVEEADRAEVERLLSALRERKQTVMEYLKGELMEKFDFALEAAPDLELGIEATILQAFSDGHYENTPAKIHTLAVGPPGVGKKLMAQAAWYINPVWKEADPTKISAAGLVGTARMSEDRRWVSDPGLIPEAHRGVFVLQDFRAVTTSSQKNAALRTFAVVMEEGECKDSTAAKKTHPAETSIHIDTNRLTDIWPGREPKDFVENIGIPMHVLTRFDIILDIPADTEREIRTALDRLRGSAKVTAKSRRKTAEPSAIRIRKLVAVLRDKHEEVNIPKHIHEYMRKRFEELRDANKERLKDLPHLSDFMQRMMNSLHKFATAHARMRDRSVCDEEDVKVALTFIGKKLEALSRLHSELKIPKGWEPRPRGEKIAEWIAQEFPPGTIVTVKDVRGAYEKRFGIPLDERTAQRWLRRAATQGRKGSWKLRTRPP